MSRRSNLSFALLLGLALVAAGCTSPNPQAAKVVPAGAPGAPADAGDPGTPAGGGTVLNAAPRVLDLRNGKPVMNNGGGSVDVFHAVIADDNAESDLAALVLLGQGPQRIEMKHTITAADLARRADRSPGPDGFGLWDAVPNDGLLQVDVRVAIPYGAAVGEYSWTLTAWDHAGDRGSSGVVVVTVEPVHVVQVEGAVTADGAKANADRWGGWSAAPGAENVRSVTYLKVVNSGTAGGQRFLVDFSSRDFKGAKDASWRVPLDGNLRFGFWEADPDQVPSQGLFTWGDTSPDGSVTLAFSQAGKVMYVAYEVVRVPSPLPSQVYHASATVTAL